MARIFISYAREDRATVRQIVEILREAGQDPWFDYALLPGQNWKQELLYMIRQCEVFLYALSPESVASEWCQWEFAEAVKMGKPVIPILLQKNTVPPDALSEIQYVDFSDGQTPQAVARLIGGLMHISIVLSPEKPPSSPSNPQGIPAQALPPEPIRLPFEPETVLIPAGPFLMGSTLEQFEVIKNKRYREWVEKSEPPQRTITLPDYRIGKYPVTVEEYREFVEGGGYHEQKWWTQAGWQQREKDGWTEPLYWGRTMYFGDDRYPISGISWYEAYAYCQWLSEETGKLYRLPNEAAWEKAARGADGRAYPWGPRWRKGVCNTRELRRVGPTPVGEFSPMGDSPYGLADMSGNVREWCVSRWFDQYVYPENDDPQGNVTRSYRSGSWLDYSPHVRCAFRRWAYPDHRDEEMGFRIAMSLPD